MEDLSLTLSSIKPGSSTASLVADALRQAILNAQLKSGASLRQEEIANQLGVSKIPVREALLTLQGEGLVVFQTGRGATVKQLSPEEAEEIYLMRIALEPIALRRAVPILNEQDLIASESILRRIDEERDPVKWAGLDLEFHLSLCSKANLPHLLSTLRMLQTNVMRYFFAYEELFYRTQINAEHWTILRACRRGDADDACAELEEHLQLASAELVKFLRRIDQ